MRDAASMDDFVRYCCGDPDCPNDCEREQPPAKSAGHPHKGEGCAKASPEIPAVTHAGNGGSTAAWRRRSRWWFRLWLLVVVSPYIVGLWTAWK